MLAPPVPNTTKEKMMVTQKPTGQQRSVNRPTRRASAVSVAVGKMLTDKIDRVADGLLAYFGLGTSEDRNKLQLALSRQAWQRTEYDACRILAFALKLPAFAGWDREDVILICGELLPREVPHGAVLMGSGALRSSEFHFIISGGCVALREPMSSLSSETKDALSKLVSQDIDDGVFSERLVQLFGDRREAMRQLGPGDSFGIDDDDVQLVLADRPTTLACVDWSSIARAQATNKPQAAHERTLASRCIRALQVPDSSRDAETANEIMSYISSKRFFRHFSRPVLEAMFVRASLRYHGKRT